MRGLRRMAMGAVAGGTIAFGALMALMASAASAASAADDPWPDLARQIFQDQALADGSGLFALDMPYRAEDAAVVPLTFSVKLRPGDARKLKALTLVIDQNPAPLAAAFTFGDKADIDTISTRVRVNSYTNVHAVAQLSDGKLYVVQRFVKAAGGCSAPGIKDEGDAKVALGEMRFRLFPPPPPASAQRGSDAQIMIRHPNNSGLQMDQITHLYIPPFFIRDLKVWQGDELMLAMEGGISISENPSFRFRFRPNGATAFRAQAVDTDGHVFKGEWPATSAM